MVAFGSSNVSSDNGRLDFQGLAWLVSKDLEKKKLTDIGLFGFGFLKELWIIGFLRNWSWSLFGYWFWFLSDMGLIDYVSINF